MSKLRNAPVLAAALSLALGPVPPLSAQDSLPTCAEGQALPCAADDGTVIETAEDLAALLEAQAAAEAAAAEAAAAEQAAAEAAAAEAAAAEQAAAEAAAAEQAAAEAESTGSATADAVEEVTPEIIVDDVPVTAAAAGGDAGSDAEAAEVETVEVTEDDTRSSAEDFDTAAAASGQNSAQARRRDSGLSNFEKALLLGLGAVVVGSVLANGDEVVANTGDRVVVDRGGELVVLKDDDVLLRQPGAQVTTETFSDGSSRTIVLREDGTRIETIRAADGRVLRRDRVLPDGTYVQLFDDTVTAEPVRVSDLPPAARMPEATLTAADIDALRAALSASAAVDPGRSFSLSQVRRIKAVRDLAPVVTLDAITFDTGSAAISPDQAAALFFLGQAIEEVIDENPGAVILVEGHTDAVGDAGYNLTLSDRRAESVALALTEYFGIPPENLVTQGYGEAHLKVPTQEAERLNRRAAVRNITALLR